MVKHKIIAVVIVLVLEAVYSLLFMPQALIVKNAACSHAVFSALSPDMAIGNTYVQEAFLTKQTIPKVQAQITKEAGIALTGLSQDRIAQIRAMFVGDIHGNYKAFLELLKHACFIDDNLDWIGGQRTLVQMGDVVDRGPEADALKTWDLLDKLQKQARQAGGTVVRLIGNHEFLYVTEYYRVYPERAIDNGMYVSIGPMLRPNFTTAEKWRYKITRSIKNGEVIAAWNYGNKIVTHAGVDSYFTDAGKAIETLVEEFNYLLREGMWWHEIFQAGKSRGKADNPHSGILWADYYKDLVPRAKNLIPQILAHTPTLHNKIEALGENNAVVNVDVGLNPYYGAGWDAWVVIEQSPQSLAAGKVSSTGGLPNTKVFVLPAYSTWMEESI